MGKIFLFAIIAVAIIIGIVTLGNKAVTSPYLDASSSSPTPIISSVLSTVQQPTSTQTTQQNNSQIGPQSATMSATIKTSKGDIVLTLYRAYAPNTTQNFVNKAKSGYYKGMIFHRVEDWVIQGGDPQGNGTGGGGMQTELNEIPFVTGSLGVARGQDINISNDSQFFITKSDASWLTKQYTNFGVVTQGMDVVNSIKIGDKILRITVDQ